MKILIVTAHPSGMGFTKRIAEQYKKTSEEIGHKVEVLDLYGKENKQDFLFFENVREIPFDLSVKKMQEKILEAREIVFIFPVWWNAEPAIMKNFWDNNMVAGFAYKYIDEKPKGLLGGKTARVFMTSDGPIYLQWLLLNPLRRIWSLARLRFCGIKMKSYTVFDVMRGRDEQNREKLLQMVDMMARQN